MTDDPQAIKSEQVEDHQSMRKSNENLDLSNSRRGISKRTQIEVFRRDKWMCSLCGCPVIFAPALRYLEKFVRQSGNTTPLAYYHLHWTRRDAPLLDYFGATVDHVEAHCGGGKHGIENFATACNTGPPMVLQRDRGESDLMQVCLYESSSSVRWKPILSVRFIGLHAFE